jgi:antitoxin (DNA-binding transcriptional repressor) of toxin-antitoxin stability system
MTSEAVTQFNIHDAKTNLSRIIERVEHGEEIVISRAGSRSSTLRPSPPRYFRARPPATR